MVSWQRPRHQGPGDAGEIVPRRRGEAPVRRRARSAVTRRGLPGAKLQHQRPARCKQPPCVGGDRPIGIEPVEPAIERAARIVVAHLGRQRRDVARAHIGRVGDDQVERSRRAPRRNRRRRTPRGPPSRVPRALSRAQARAAVLDIGADAEGFRQFGQQREQERARAGAEIGDAQRAATARFGSSAASAASTTVSVSGRGTSVSALSRSGSPQNSLRPRMRATGSRASRRAASAAMAPASLGGEPAVRLRGERGVIERRARAPTSRRASSSGVSRPRRRNSAARWRRAPATEAPGSSSAATVVTPFPRPPAARPDARSPARR